jgi:YVTN family beta-propeller protein
MHYFKIIFLLLLLVSCKKKKVSENDVNTNFLSNGMMVLCQGLFQQNNSTISWVDLATGSSDDLFFTNRTGRLLGDTGNDMKVYGGKIYVVVNVSSTIEVLDRSTGNSIKQISMLNGLIAKQPRSIAFHGSKAYITCFDGYVDVLDTVSLTITDRIQVGANPEGLAISNGKLYVSNSGGLNSPNLDSTVSVINLSSNQEIKKITVGKNPGTVKVDTQGDIYVIARGNYSSIPSRMVKINAQTDVLESTFSFDASGIEVMGNDFLINSFNYSTSTNNVSVFNTLTESISNSSFIDNSHFTTFYGMQYRPSNNKIYCFDAMGYSNTGYVRVFSVSGVYESSYHVGLNPSKIIFHD